MKRMRWVLGGAGVLVVVLIGVVIFISQQGAPTEAAIKPVVDNQPQIQTSRIEVLVAAQRIEEGAQLQRTFFTSQAWESERLPEGAILYSELDKQVGKYAKSLINANLPVLRDQIVDQPPLSTLQIPPGFRAVTITVDQRSGVEGFAKPGSRVDVLFKFTDRDGKSKVVTIVRFTKILSVGGVARVAEGGIASITASGTTVTLLVSERDAKKIELASSAGSLSLSLVGETERPVATDKSDIIDLSTLTGETQEQQVAEEPVQGKMFMTDPATGRNRLFVLRNNKWVPEDGQ
jgi:pilus assembly protein CpaB